MSVTLEYYLGYFVSSITGQVIPIPSKANTAVPIKLMQVYKLIIGFPPSEVSINPPPFFAFLMP